MRIGAVSVRLQVADSATSRRNLAPESRENSNWHGACHLSGRCSEIFSTSWRSTWGRVQAGRQRRATSAAFLFFPNLSSTILNPARPSLRQPTCFVAGSDENCQVQSGNGAGSAPCGDYRSNADPLKMHRLGLSCGGLSCSRIVWPGKCPLIGVGRT
jgi:hypothetical protein